MFPRFLPALALALLAIGCESAPSYTRSVQPLRNAQGGNFCTAFSINESEGLWATAAHCVTTDASEVFTVGSDLAEAIYIDDYWEIAVVQSQRHGPALPLRSAPLAVEDPVVMWGHPYGWLVLTRVEGRVAAVGQPVGAGIVASTIFDITTGGGNSGSPIMVNGEVVSILWGAMRQSPHSLGTPTQATYRILKPFTE